MSVKKIIFKVKIQKILTEFWVVFLTELVEL